VIIINEFDCISKSGYQIVGCPCHYSENLERSMTSQPRVMTSSNGNLYNKRFENGPNDIVLVGGNENGDPVTIQYKNCTL
jgi:hypothetical protein